MGKEFRLGEVTGIGRDAALNDIVIDDPKMSGQHAKVKLEKKRFVLYDLGSTNKTFVNGKEVYRRILTDGDTITTGDTTFTFMELKEKKGEKKKSTRRGQSKRKKGQEGKKD